MAATAPGLSSISRSRRKSMNVTNAFAIQNPACSRVTIMIARPICRSMDSGKVQTREPTKSAASIRNQLRVEPTTCEAICEIIASLRLASIRRRLRSTRRIRSSATQTTRNSPMPVAQTRSELPNTSCSMSSNGFMRPPAQCMKSRF